MGNQRKEQALTIAKRNTTERNLQKAYEELIELSLELIQRVNKPHKNNDGAIIKEIADVKIRLWYLEERYGKKNINHAIDNKLNILKHVNIRRRRDKQSVS